MATKMIDRWCLDALGACEEQVALFVRTFGDESIPITARTVAKAHAAGLDVLWLAGSLSNAALDEYAEVRDAALAEYEKVRVPALAEYQKVRDAALDEYQKVRVPAWDEYQKVRVPAWDEYQKVCDAAWDEHQKVRDAALIRIWNADTEGE
jgi:hypothetical protein